MANEEVYAGGLLNRALDPATQPPEIQAYLQAEIDLLNEVIRRRAWPCSTSAAAPGGTWPCLRIVYASASAWTTSIRISSPHAARVRTQHLHFVTADATAVPLAYGFDLAICMTNTWGTMSDKAGVLREMRRLSPRPRSRLLSVYSPASVPARREWYRRLEQPVLEVSDEYILTQEGFRSEHFSADRLRCAGRRL